MSILRGAGILWRSIYAVIVELSGGNGRLLFSIEGDEHQSMKDLSYLGGASSSQMLNGLRN